MTCNIGYGQLSPTDKTVNLPAFDLEKVHYGFSIGVSSANYKFSYDDLWATQDTLHSIIPQNNLGFKLGFIVDFHLWQYLNLRVSPTVSFNQLGLDYRVKEGEEPLTLTTLTHLIDPSYFEFPILFKYKSVRRENRGMYMLAGITPAVRVSNNRFDRDDPFTLPTSKYNLSLEIGAGMDLYQPLFKFSPEIRYSYGLMDLMDNSYDTDLNQSIDKLFIHSVTFVVTFEGGPSTLSKFRKK